MKREGGSVSDMACLNFAELIVTLGLKIWA